MRNLLLLALLFPTFALAQEDASYTFTLRKYSVADGLAHRRVNAVVQDRAGFLWLATAAGVQRFDGYTFTLYTQADGLQALEVGSMWMDGNGLIWLFYNAPGVNLCTGVDILDPSTGHIAPFEQHFGRDQPFQVTDLVHWVRYMDDSTMYIGARGRLVSYHPRRGFRVTPFGGAAYFNPMHRFPDGSTIGVGFVPTIAHDRLLVRNADGSVRDTIAERSAIIPLNGVERTLEGHLRAGGEASRKGVYLAWRKEPNGVVGECWMPLGEEPVLLRESGGIEEPWSMGRKDLGNGLWLVHTTVRRLHAGDDPLQGEVLYDLAAAHPEIEFRIYDVFVDAQRNVWVCTEFGLYRLVLRPSRFQRMLWSEVTPQGFGKRVRGMLVQEGAASREGSRLLVNTEEEGFWALDARDGRVLGRDTLRMLRFGIASDEKGHVWRSMEDTVREYLADGLTATGRRFTTPHGCWALYPHEGSVLAESAEGLALYGGSEAGELAPLRTTGEMAAVNALGVAHVLHIGRDRSGGLWACASNGLYRLSGDGGPVERWSLDADAAHRIPAMDVRHFMEDESGIFWLATGDAGLVRWDRRTNSARAITRRDGMPSDAVHAVYADAQGQCWLPTDNGLVRYDPVSGRITVFTEADGITHKEFNRLAHARGPDGRLYFGGLNGITAFDPDSIADQVTAVRTPLVITGVQQFSGDVAGVVDRTREVRSGAGVTLRPGDRFVNITFALLSYGDPGSILYGWRIDGVDADWNYQREPNLRITTLPFGGHRLRIKAQGSDGNWSAQELVVPITVVRPFWLRWWFIALGVLTVSAIVYGVFRYRLAQAKKVLAMRDRIAADLHDEVGSSLSNIAMFGELMRDQLVDQPPRVQRMLERITSNSAKALESMNDIVWNVNTRYEGTEHLVARMRSFAVQVAEAKGFALRFGADDALRHVKLDMMHRKHLYLIFKEAVNNAAKYSGCSELRVELTAAGKGVRLVVADNGRGFAQGDRDARGGGQGLVGMRQRAADIGAELTVTSEPGTGTTVMLEPGGNGGSRRSVTQQRVGSGSFAP